MLGSRAADDLESDCAAFGLSPPDRPPPDDQMVDASLLPVIRLFRAGFTQWRVAGIGGVIGLDYAALQLIAMAMTVLWNAQTIADLRVMECAALSEMNKE